MNHSRCGCPVDCPVQNPGFPFIRPRLPETKMCHGSHTSSQSGGKRKSTSRSKSKSRSRNTSRSKSILRHPSIPHPSPNLDFFQSAEGICDNGGIRRTSYFKNGQRVNVFGVPLTDKQIKQQACRGCHGFRCSKAYFAHSTIAQRSYPHPKKNRSSKPYGIYLSQDHPKYVNYFSGPLPDNQKRLEDPRRPGYPRPHRIPKEERPCVP